MRELAVKLSQDCALAITLVLTESLCADIALYSESAEDARRCPRPRQCYYQVEPVVEQYKGNQGPPSSPSPSKQSSKQAKKEILRKDAEWEIGKRMSPLFSSAWEVNSAPSYYVFVILFFSSSSSLFTSSTLNIQHLSKEMT